MLFNTYAFILVFLPVTLIGFFLLARFGKAFSAGWLTLASLAFYAHWNPRFLPLLLGSIAFNFTAGRLLPRCPAGPRRKALLAASISANLLLLGYYKYAGFLVDNANMALGLGWSIGHIVLPLGISFFTFTQIAYLVDVYRGDVKEANLLHYALFVTYFPHLIAGPILHHAEMMPQFARDDVYRWDTCKFATGLAVFAFGLAKKVVLADGIAAFAGPVFQAADAGGHPGLAEAWGGALAYTFQLYFDFSGYCDMAIGLSWMFGIGLPLNFDSPYKARDIADFWRRWHMTLSRFLRDYLYIPLGGNRSGSTRRYINLMATMLIGGLWHGAGWTFVVWGGLHGLFLMVNHAWSVLRRGLPLAKAGRAEILAGWALTFVAVVVGWVFFRATTLGGGLRIVAGMVGLNPSTPIAFGAGGTTLPLAAIWCVALGAIAFLMPNTEELVRHYLPAIARPARERSAALSFAPNLHWAAAVALVLAAGLIGLPAPTSFLYFNF